MSRGLCEDCGRPFIDAFTTHDGKLVNDCAKARCSRCEEDSGCHVACVVPYSGWVRHPKHGLLCEDCALALEGQ